MAQFDEVKIGDCRLIHGDCREVLPLLPRFDLILTDPPYGIGLDYSETFKDTEGDLIDLISWFMPQAILKAKVLSITPGNLNQYLYPKPTWTLCWFNRAGTGSGPWGFSCWQPIMCYGPDPYLSSGKGRRGDYIEWSEGSEKKRPSMPKANKVYAKMD